MREIRFIVLHCTASPQTQTVQAILDYWRKVLGWKNPGYHHLITPDGVDNNILPISEIANGVAGYNAHAIHISYIGGVEVIKSKDSKGKPINVLGKAVDNRTSEQIATMLSLVLKYHKMFPLAEIKGHRDFSIDKNRDGIIQPNEWMKTCPSFSAAEWIKCCGIK